MNSTELRPLNQLRQTAQRMIRSLGVRDALACCASNQWIGLMQEIESISGHQSICHQA